jgi:hypothetical protein
MNAIGESEAKIRCPLCGAEAVRGGAACSCPLSLCCGLLRCEHCSYEFPDPARSRLAGWLARWFGKEGRVQQ